MTSLQIFKRIAPLQIDAMSNDRSLVTSRLVSFRSDRVDMADAIAEN
jgi:hypothetical protein